MAKAQKPTSPAPPHHQQPQIYEATRGGSGAVTKGRPLTQGQAELRRRAGFDVVVCGTDLRDNRRLAGLVESKANGSAKRCPPHASAGAYALPHYQPDPRPPDGHTFYETPNRKAL